MGVIAKDNSRNDCMIMLSPYSWLLVVCFGPVDEWGQPLTSAETSISRITAMDSGTLLEPPEPDVIVGCEAVRYVLDLRSRHRLREWKFIREGWLFGIGIKRDLGDKSGVDSLATRVLNSWTWLPVHCAQRQPAPDTTPKDFGQRNGDDKSTP